MPNVTICGHEAGSPCPPVTSGELAAAIVPFVVLPFLALWLRSAAVVAHGARMTVLDLLLCGLTTRCRRQGPGPRMVGAVPRAESGAFSAGPPPRAPHHVHLAAEPSMRTFDTSSHALAAAVRASVPVNAFSPQVAAHGDYGSIHVGHGVGGTPPRRMVPVTHSREPSPGGTVRTTMVRPGGALGFADAARVVRLEASAVTGFRNAVVHRRRTSAASASGGSGGSVELSPVTRSPAAAARQARLAEAAASMLAGGSRPTSSVLARSASPGGSPGPAARTRLTGAAATVLAAQRSASRAVSPVAAAAAAAPGAVCRVCTCVNPPGSPVCEMCLTPLR